MNKSILKEHADIKYWGKEGTQKSPLKEFNKTKATVQKIYTQNTKHHESTERRKTFHKS